MDYSFPGILKIAGQEGMEGYIPTTAQNNMQGYGDYMEAEQMKAEQERQAALQAEQEKRTAIASIQSQIKVLEQRIASNTNKLKAMLNGNDVADELASLEAGKIGFRFNRQQNNDPTSLFRWAQGRKDTQEQMAQSIANNKANDDRAIKNFGNTVSYFERMRLSNNTDMLEQQLDKVNGAIRDGMNIGADVSRLYLVKDNIENKLNGGGSNTPPSGSSGWTGTSQEQAIADAKNFLNGEHTSKEIKNYIDKNSGKIEDNDIIIALNNALNKSIRKEKDAANAKAFRDFRAAWMKRNNFTEADMPDFEDDVRKAFNNRGK